MQPSFTRISLMFLRHPKGLPTREFACLHSLKTRIHLQSLAIGMPDDPARLLAGPVQTARCWKCWKDGRFQPQWLWG